MLKITYWSDYACPYCYIAEARLKKAIASMPRGNELEIEMKAFQLDPSAGKHAAEDTQTRFAKKYRIPFDDAGKRIDAISRLGIAEGLDFRYATTRFTNTADAHRLTKLAYRHNDPVLYERVIESLFKAYFTDNLELADIALLQKIGEDAGLDPDEVSALLASEEYQDEVANDQLRAARLGIYAVPHFVIGKYTVPGAQSAEVIKSVILEALGDAGNSELSGGMCCGPDGCRLG